MKEQSKMGRSRLDFSQGVLSISMYIEWMRDRIPIEMFEIFVIRRDWKHAIDFFVIKGITENTFNLQEKPNS
jgi:hypothetical protein